jgi:hypothetical protein
MGFGWCHRLSIRRTAPQGVQENHESQSLFKQTLAPCPGVECGFKSSATGKNLKHPIQLS